MTIAPTDPLIPQLAEAMGLDPKRCRSIDLHLRTNDVVTATVQEYVEAYQAGSLIKLFRSGEYVLVRKEEWDALQPPEATS